MKIYQLMGTPEGPLYVNGMYRMEDSLTAAGFGSAEVLSVEKGDGAHSEWFWAREFETAYLWLFGNTQTTIEPSLSTVAISVYPVPAKEELHIKLNTQFTGQLQIDILDANGKLIEQVRNEKIPAGDHQWSVSLRELNISTGLYLCRIRIDDQEQGKKFILNP